jgi:hypothetical protein
MERESKVAEGGVNLTTTAGTLSHRPRLPVRPRPRRVILVESLGSDAGAVRPRDRATVEEEVAEAVRGLQRLEYRTFQPLAKIDRLFGVVVERHVDAIAATVFRAYH